MEFFAVVTDAETSQAQEYARQGKALIVARMILVVSAPYLVIRLICGTFTKKGTLMEKK